MISLALSPFGAGVGAGTEFGDGGNGEVRVGTGQGTDGLIRIIRPGGGHAELASQKMFMAKSPTVVTTFARVMVRSLKSGLSRTVVTLSRSIKETHQAR